MRIEFSLDWQFRSELMSLDW
ncbi:hypothetical protein F383_30695 [Gossypium arboreum]|uniref:Uncharacterized protein n=1 Tax=Gossypium arboreum TaxID=29729 RepID=A0A0B0P5S0_GOSAR|nr:hypothetical protein F383_25358 [Gossypium arboreum]KHG24459.1 hypothetical protein F383_30695 [Gossypium arboreum]